MSVLIELNIEYNRNFSKAVLALANENYVVAKMYLERAAKALNEIVQRRTGETRDYTQDWLMDIVKDIADIERKINNDRSKQKLTKMLQEKGCFKTDEVLEPNNTESKFQAAEIPKTTFEDIAGLDGVKEAVTFKAIYPKKYPELYEKLKKRSGGGILLYGLPGTGKTLIAEAIAHETGATFFPIKCSDLGSKWFGETEKNIRDIFTAAREAKNAVIFFDEIEAYASNRREHSAMERSVPEFLAQMQGVGEGGNNERILIIGATNKPWRIDGAFLRPGRFDDKIYVPLPDEWARRRIMDIKLNGVPMQDGINLDYFVEKTEGYNGADIDYLCEKAKEFALKRIIDNKDTNELLTREDFELALTSVKSSVLKVDREEMESWERSNGLSIPTSESKPAKVEQDDPLKSDKAEYYLEALRFAVKRGEITRSILQKRLGVSFILACKIISWMTEQGFVEGDGLTLKVLLTKEKFEEIFGGKL